MRRALIDDPRIDGALLVRDLHGPTGDVLARAGLRLSVRAGRALREHGIAACFVEDAACVGVEFTPLVDGQGRDASFVRALRETYELVAHLVEGPARQPTSRALEELRDLRIVGALDTSGAMEALRAAVHGMVERHSLLDASAGFVTDRHASDDLEGHSAGVAILAVRLGADLGLSHGDLVWTALAAAFHDIGLLMVPGEIRRTPAGQRTAGQQRRYEDHTVLGQAVLRRLERRAPALPLVAVEHHEHQSGGGYPHGVRGGNRILRPAAAEGAPTKLALVSELIAVADRYERLVSPAPGAPPLSPAAARHVVSAEAGSVLNAEVVGRFLDLVPRWPLGTEVVLRGGQHEGARGVVVKLGARGKNRPVVRVFEDASEAPLIPVDVALASHPAVTPVPVDSPELAA